VTTEPRSAPPAGPYPPAPWQMAGQFWMGFPPVTDPVTVPPDVRYTAGTLTYNELAVGPLVRRGAHGSLGSPHLGRQPRLTMGRTTAVGNTQAARGIHLAKKHLERQCRWTTDRDVRT
jgi:hypothetical protein